MSVDDAYKQGFNAGFNGEAFAKYRPHLMSKANKTAFTKGFMDGRRAKDDRKND